MKGGYWLFCAVAGALAWLTACSDGAFAQKSADTLRIAEVNPIRSVDYYMDPGPHTDLLSRMAYDSLVEFNEYTGKIVPQLAKSWERPQPTVLEFELRDDVKWHDGEPFTADDVVYTLDWLKNPATRIRSQGLYAWIESVEKLGPYKVRVTAKTPTSYDLLRIAYTYIYPKHAHSTYANPIEFGRKPIGTGPYKITQVDADRGVIAVRNDQYFNTDRPRSNIGRVTVRTIPDTGAQVAAMLAGQIDFVRGLPPDEATALAMDPRFKTSVSQGLGYFWMTFDAKGRTANKALMDERVRRALVQAIDKKALARFIGSGTELESPGQLCWKAKQQGCDWSVAQPDYNPAKAKQLLAEAGYPNGFNLKLNTFIGRIASAAEIVAGDLRKVGVRATIEATPPQIWHNRLRDNQLEASFSAYSLGRFPDIQATLDYFFAGGPYDQFGDEDLLKKARGTDTIMDPDERRKLARDVFDSASGKVYMATFASLPYVFSHTSDVELRPVEVNVYGVEMSRINWKK